MCFSHKTGKFRSESNSCFWLLAHCTVYTIPLEFTSILLRIPNLTEIGMLIILYFYFDLLH